jgi:hypothetical protein
VKSFQRELAKGLHFNVPLDLSHDARRDEDLLVLCLPTKARSEIGCGAYRAVVEPLFKADRSDGGVAASDSYSEAKRMAALAPETWAVITAFPSAIKLIWLLIAWASASRLRLASMDAPRRGSLGGRFNTESI